MSLPPRILCRSGCGDFGDPELDFLCVDCHGDRLETQQQRELQEYIRKKNQGATATAQAEHATSGRGNAENGAEAPSPTRRGPPSINHQQAFIDFLNRPRERDASVVSRENQFLERELQIRETNKVQLRKYMVATDEGEPVDPKEWSRYKYGAPRDVPRHDVDEATEFAAQIKLFCYWRKRTLRQRIETKRQLLLAAEREKQSTAARLFASSAASFKANKSKRSSLTSGVSTESMAAMVGAMHVPERAKEMQKRASLLMPAWPKKKSTSQTLAT